MQWSWNHGCFWASVFLLLSGCASTDSSVDSGSFVGRFEQFVDGVSEARFSGHAVASGWYFRICEQHTDLEYLKGEEVRVRVMNEGPAVWVDYLSGAAQLERGRSVTVYEGTLRHLVEPCGYHEWQWVVFKRDAPERGTVKLLIIMEFRDRGVRVSRSISLDAWYSKVVSR